MLFESPAVVVLGGKCMAPKDIITLLLHGDVVENVLYIKWSPRVQKSKNKKQQWCGEWLNRQTTRSAIRVSVIDLPVEWNGGESEW